MATKKSNKQLWIMLALIAVIIAAILYFSAFLNCPMVSFAAMIPPGHASVHLRRRGKFQF